MAAFVFITFALWFPRLDNIIKPDFKRLTALFTVPFTILLTLTNVGVPNGTVSTALKTTLAAVSAVGHSAETTLVITARIIDIADAVRIAAVRTFVL
jgi:hypothetical protein